MSNTQFSTGKALIFRTDNAPSQPATHASITKKDFVTVKEYEISHGNPESSLESKNTEYNNRNA